MLRNKQQNKRLHGLLNELKLEADELADFKKQKALHYSNGRTDSTSKLLVHECQALINELGVVRPTVRKEREKAAQELDPSNKMRRKILSICREMGNEWFNGSYNWPKINAWLEKFGYLHKGLNDYTEAELPKLVTQFESLLKSHYAKR